MKIIRKFFYGFILVLCLLEVSAYFHGDVNLWELLGGILLLSFCDALIDFCITEVIKNAEFWKQ